MWNFRLFNLTIQQNYTEEDDDAEEGFYEKYKTDRKYVFIPI